MEEALNSNYKNEKGMLINGSHNSLEIEHHCNEDANGHHQNHSKISGDFILEHMSVSLMDASNNNYLLIFSLNIIDLFI